MGKELTPIREKVMEELTEGGSSVPNLARKYGFHETTLYRWRKKYMGKPDQRLDTLKTLEALSGVKVELREFCSDWILLTYDLPKTKEGDKARATFLKKVREIGALPHTESVYLLPWTPESEAVALDVASIGSAFLWISKVKDETIAIGLTTKYDLCIVKEVETLSKRLDKIQTHWNRGKKKLALKMMISTWGKVDKLVGVVARRGSVKLMLEIAPMVTKLKELVERAWA